MNREYSDLEMEVIVFDTEDVMTDSVGQIPVSSDQAEWLP